ncbi:Crp/Fnr family transcriptional regulator [Mucilaginibacter flavus]|uniref:Crp/Fnr family transcriptional regulator n=1 Tax=Mucilaginibacter flavus TaxID=931504 RepID=UPI0025B30A26|nr:Crp/Fnr family transcriptional regulator [Mucilaginibacter flavus]MDN3584658.1 Crp/Fnr family transcriptional regulator [Mucilaginibacter flavus]
MKLQLLLTHIRQFVDLKEEDQTLLDTLVIERPFKKGELIVKSGDAARYLAYVNSGYTVTYFTDSAGNEHVVRFAAPGWWTGDVYSLGSEPVTPLTTRALCDGSLLLLPRTVHNQLLKDHPKFERYFRHLFQGALMRHQMLFVESRSLTAELRYLKFQNTFPGIEQFLPQKYIASYLGITPEFLSKLRRTLANSKA